MKSTLKALVLALIVLCGSASAALTNSQGHLGARNPREKMEKSHLGKALVGLLELESATAAGDGVGKLFAALDLLKQNLVNKKEAEIADFNEDEEVHTAEVTRIDGLIAQYNSQITVVTQELEDLKSEQEKLENDLKRQNAQLENAEAGEESEKQTLVNLENNFKQASEDYQSAIDLLGQAIVSLDEAQEEQAKSDAKEEAAASEAAAPEAAASEAALLQVKRKESWRFFADNLEAKIKKTKKESFVKPLVNFFSQLSSEQDEIDVDSTERAKKALEDLRIYYSNGLEGLGKTYESQVEEHEALLKELGNQISTLTNIVIPRTTTDIESNKQNIEAKGNELTDTQANVLHQQGQLTAENESWEKRVETNNLLVPEYEDEYEIVLQAENVLKQSYPGRG